MDNNLKNLITFLFIALPTIVILMFVMKAYSLDTYDEDAQDKTIELLQNVVPTIQESFWLPDCRITQGESEHHEKESGHILAIDIACVKDELFWVFAPRTHEEYEVAYIGTDKRLWTYTVLKNGDTRYIYGHTDNGLASIDKNDKVKSWQLIGFTNLSWISTNYHVHVEKWIGKNNVSMVDGRVNEFSKKLCDQREWEFCQDKVEMVKKRHDLEKFYFTHYDLWDYKQNDSAPCHGASGVDLCYLARNGIQTMALTSDIRKQLWVKFWDKVVLEWDEWCKGIYEVHDEMNIRFRTGCIKRPWTNYCIKGDLPWKVWGACTVKKIVY